MKLVSNILKKPITLFIAMALGVLAGIYIGEEIKALGVIKDIYLTFLQMCALPIVACAVTINLSKIFKKKLSNLIKKWLLFTILFFILASVLTFLLSGIFKNFLQPNLDAKLSFANMSHGSSINKTLTELEFYPDSTYKPPNNEFSLYNFLINTIPKNIFLSLSNGDTIKIIFFFGILGAMMAISNQNENKSLIKIAEDVYNCLSKFIDIILVFSPISFFCILAVEFSDSGKTSLVKSIIQLILVIYLIYFVIITISFLIISFKTKISFTNHIKAIKRTFLIAVGTRSCLASIPTATKDAKEKFNLNSDIVDLTLPVGISLAQSGGMVSATMAVIYASIIYETNFNFNIFIGTIAGGITYCLSFIGVPGVVAVNMLASVLSPLSLPSDVILIIWFAILPIIDPILTFQSVYSNIATTCLISEKNSNTEVIK